MQCQARWAPKPQHNDTINNIDYLVQGQETIKKHISCEIRSSISPTLIVVACVRYIYTSIARAAAVWSMEDTGRERKHYPVRIKNSITWDHEHVHKSKVKEQGEKNAARSWR